MSQGSCCSGYWGAGHPTPGQEAFRWDFAGGTAYLPVSTDPIGSSTGDFDTAEFLQPLGIHVQNTIPTGLDGNYHARFRLSITDITGGTLTSFSVNFMVIRDSQLALYETIVSGVTASQWTNLIVDAPVSLSLEAGDIFDVLLEDVVLVEDPAILLTAVYDLRLTTREVVDPDFESSTERTLYAKELPYMLDASWVDNL